MLETFVDTLPRGPYYLGTKGSRRAFVQIATSLEKVFSLQTVPVPCDMSTSSTPGFSKVASWTWRDAIAQAGLTILGLIFNGYTYGTGDQGLGG